MQYMNGDPTGYGFVCFGPSNPFFGYDPPDKPFGDPTDPEEPPAQQDDRTDCERMAADAERIAQEVANDYPGANASWRLQEFNKRYGQITFGSYFSEGLFGFMGTPTSSGRNPTANRNYSGASGFPTQFLDTEKPTEDQVHHFGAYFSAGLAGHKAAPDQHRRDDRNAGNQGDVRLADQSRRLGDYFRAHPTQLTNVGDIIRRVICNGEEVPK
jgi:hypothetical protein